MINYWIGEGYQTSIAAAGTTQATATLLTSAINNVTTVSAGQGVVLPLVAPGYTVGVYNSSATPVKVYPPVGATLNALGTNNAALLAPNTWAAYTFATINQWFVNLSA
jgi:hypothetical protein